MRDSVREVLDNLGIESLWEWQENAVRSVLSSEKNFLLNAPTGSGKSLVAYIVIKEYLGKGKIVYAVPSHSLVNEKVEELKRALGNDVVIRKTGSRDFIDADVVVGTYESVFMLLRRNRYFLDSVVLAVLDDFHILYDRYRGSKLEKLIAFLLASNVRILALSATVRPIEKLANWLSAEYVVGETPSQRVTVNRIFMSARKREEILGVLAKNRDLYAPVIVFCPTKSQSKSLAQKMVEVLKEQSKGSPRVARKRQVFAEDVLEVLEEERGVEITDEVRELAEAMEAGVAWHNSDLDLSVREYVEELFRRGYLDFVFATTTLAHGVNTPAKTVVIFPMRAVQYVDGSGKVRWRTDWIPVYEWLQMAGRAGRVGFIESDEAYVITVVSSEKEADEARARYSEENIESVVSYLRGEELERFILELIGAGYSSEDDILKVFGKTYRVSEQFRPLMPPELKGEVLNRLRSEAYEALHSLTNRGWIDVSEKGYILTTVGGIVLDFLDSTFVTYSLSAIQRLVEYIKGLSHSQTLPISAYDIAIPVIEFFGLHVFPSRKELRDQNVIMKLNKILLEVSPYSDKFEMETLVTWYLIKERWAKGVPKPEIEGEFGSWAVHVDSVAKPLGQILSGLVMPVALHFGVPLSPEYRREVEEILYGLPEGMLPLYRHIRHLGRVKIIRLYKTMSESMNIIRNIFDGTRSRGSANIDVDGIMERLSQKLKRRDLVGFLEVLYTELEKVAMGGYFIGLLKRTKGIGDTLSQRITEFISKRATHDNIT